MQEEWQFPPWFLGLSNSYIRRVIFLRPPCCERPITCGESLRRHQVEQNVRENKGTRHVSPKYCDFSLADFVDQESRLIWLAGWLVSVLHVLSVRMDGWIYFLESRILQTPSSSNAYLLRTALPSVPFPP